MIDIEQIAGAIGCGDMGTGISLRAVLTMGMAPYYPDDHHRAARCVEWALRRAAKRVLRASGTEAGTEGRDD